MTFGGTYELLTTDTGCVATKVGGKPALDLESGVPICRQCGGEMTFLLQFLWPETDPDAHRGAAVFMCSDKNRSLASCETDNAMLGANAVVLIKNFRAVPPSGEQFAPPFKVHWRQHEELTDDVWALDILDTEHAVAQKDHDQFIKEFGYTKMGGHPLWLQNPETPKCPFCGGKTVFAAQFDSNLGSGRLGEHYSLPFSGVGYLFLCANRCSERGGAFLWQSRE